MRRTAVLCYDTPSPLFTTEYSGVWIANNNITMEAKITQEERRVL